METIFILYSCKKNLEKTNKTYDKIYDKSPHGHPFGDDV